MSVVLHDGKIVGAKYRTAISHDGSAVVSHDGLRPTSDREWNIIWDGYHFAQPSANTVLYLPGHPGSGSTIYDYSYNFNDSGINTNEEAAQGETAIDCDADATTAIPVGSIIQVEDEYMYVTGTGATITVVRGYLNSADVLHDTGKDIYVWIPNNGAITNALWEQLPSGLWYLNFDGTGDKVTIADDSSLDLTGDFTIEFWVNLNSVASGTVLLSKQIDADNGYVIEYYSANKAWLLLNERATAEAQKITDTNSHTATGVWNHLAWTLATSTHAFYDAGVSLNLGVVGGFDFSDDTDLKIGQGSSASDLNGKVALPRIHNRALSAGELRGHYNQERHLFAV